jgi:hypothetical protein
MYDPLSNEVQNILIDEVNIGGETNWSRVHDKAAELLNGDASAVALALAKLKWDLTGSTTEVNKLMRDDNARR